ncbi:MAG: hypothetical protein E7487_05905 [Ruminococcaceae bacterium]|nr:hypothetical protein [Oscillospiraceae bacterium]
MKKLLALLLALTMIIVCFAGCADTTDDGSSKDTDKSSAAADDKDDEKDSDDGDAEDGLVVSKDGSLPIVSEKIDTMTMTLLVGPTDKDPNEMWFFNYYDQLTNVDWQITPILNSDWGEKKAVVIGSGDYTDVYWSTGWTTGDIYNYGSSGIFIDLAPYYDYAPDYKAAMDLVEGSYQYVTTPDGANYSLAMVNPTNWYAANGLTLWIDSTWLANLGYDFTDDYVITTDELYEVLSAFKTEDADGDGNSDNEIPMTGSWSTDVNTNIRSKMLAAFGFNTQGLTTQSIGLLDDKVVFIPTTERYKEYLIYMNKLYTEGLIDVDIFSQDDTQVKAKGAESNCGSFIYTVPFLMDPENHMDYISLAIAYDENTDPLCWQASKVAPGEFIITDTCEYPEIAMAWINLFYTPEHAFNIMYGPTMTMDQDTGEITMISEDIVDTDRGAPVILDANGNYVGVDSSEWQPNSEEWTLWDWYAYDKPVNGAYGSTLGEDYIFDNLWPGRPKTYDEQFANNEWRIEQGDANANEGWWRMNSMRSDYKWIVHGYPTVYFTDEQQTWLDENQTILEDYVYQMEAKFISGAEDIAAGYDAFIAELEKLGAAEYEKIFIDVYPKA